MSNTDDNLVKDLSQIRRQQEKVIDALDRLKENYEGDDLADIEQVERDALQTILDIEEISKRRDRELHAEIERNTVLFRIRSRSTTRRPEQIGNIRF